MPTESFPSAGRSLDEWLAWQETLNPRAIELGLDRALAVAQRLELLPAVPVTLTVAGTNGKGSSAALLAGIYRAAGYRVGLYTSPHLLRYNERIVIDGQPVEDAALCAAFARIEARRNAVPLTYFEYGTLAALDLFREAGVDVQVLEVGLGGRLDAVNIVDADAALITNIGLDHTDWLGNTREAIAREKAGVMRGGRPAVCVDPEPPAAIGEIAAALGANLLQLGRDYDYAVDDDGRWRWWLQPAAAAAMQGGAAAFSTLEALPPPALLGDVQWRNAAGVLTLLAAMQPRLPVKPAAIGAGLRNLRLPGRFERHRGVILDVAHNLEAAVVLADNLRAAGLAGNVHLVLGMFADKPVEAVAAALEPVVCATYCGDLPPPRGLSGAALAARIPRLRPQVYADVRSAYAAARAAAGDEDGIVVCGSFLTVAEIAQELAKDLAKDLARDLDG